MTKTLFFTALSMIFTIAILGQSSLAIAEEHVVIQKDKAFSEKEISVKVGDTVKFTNEDDVTHNIYSDTTDHDFQIDKQDPGQSQEVKFDKAGEIKVKCAIHPKMKMTVKVTE